MTLEMMREKLIKKYSERDVAAAIEEEIVANEMVHGVRLPSASQIAKQYAVSLKTADRALCRLAAKGLISRVRGSGSFVRTNRSAENRLHVAFVHWLYPESISELNYAAFTIFIEQICHLLEDHCFSYELIVENRPPHSLRFQSSMLKNDFIIAPAGVLEVAEDFLLQIKQQVILYGDDVVNHGPWNQIVYDYHPAFLKVLKYCTEKGFRKFFLAGANSVTNHRRLDALLEVGRNLGLSDSAFHVYYPENCIVYSAMLAGAKCARYYLEHELTDHIIISPSDFITYGMIDAFSSAGLSYGIDYQLISYDNLEGHLKNDRFKLNLNSITHPMGIHAEAVIAMLENLTRNKTRNYFQTYFTPATEFIIRKEIGMNGMKHNYSHGN